MKGSPYPQCIMSTLCRALVRVLAPASFPAPCAPCAVRHLGPCAGELQSKNRAIARKNYAALADEGASESDWQLYDRASQRRSLQASCRELAKVVVRLPRYLDNQPSVNVKPRRGQARQAADDNS